MAIRSKLPTGKSVLRQVESAGGRIGHYLQNDLLDPNSYAISLPNGEQLRWKGLEGSSLWEPHGEHLFGREYISHESKSTEDIVQKSVRIYFIISELYTFPSRIFFGCPARFDLSNTLVT